MNTEDTDQAKISPTATDLYSEQHSTQYSAELSSEIIHSSAHLADNSTGGVMAPHQSTMKSVSRLALIALAVLAILFTAACGNSAETDVAQRGVETDETSVESSQDSSTDSASENPSQDSPQDSGTKIKAVKDPVPSADTQDESQSSTSQDSEGDSSDGKDATSESQDGSKPGFRAGEPVAIDPDAADPSNVFVSDCREGDLYACDVLFQLSQYGTPEEALALNCGTNGRSTDFCTEGLRFETGATTFDPNSEGIAAVKEACVAGKMSACDLLFFRSPLNSEIQDFGNTCGERIEVAIPTCRAQLGKEG